MVEKRYWTKNMCRMRITKCVYVDWENSVNWHCGVYGVQERIRCKQMRREILLSS